MHCKTFSNFFSYVFLSLSGESLFTSRYWTAFAASKGEKVSRIKQVILRTSGAALAIWLRREQLDFALSAGEITHDSLGGARRDCAGRKFRSRKRARLKQMCQLERRSHKRNLSEQIVARNELFISRSRRRLLLRQPFGVAVAEATPPASNK